jgi:hypothetical protein
VIRAVMVDAVLLGVGAALVHPTPRAVVVHHSSRASAASFFWCLAAFHALRQRSMRPLIHHAEWRMAWRLARG